MHDAGYSNIEYHKNRIAEDELIEKNRREAHFNGIRPALN